MKKYDAGVIVVFSLLLCGMLCSCQEDASMTVHIKDNESDSMHIEWLNEKTETLGYQAADALYYVNDAVGGTSYVRRIDLHTGKDERACQDPYCMHNDEKCPFWISPKTYKVITIPVDEKLVLLHYGGYGNQGMQKKERQAWVDIVGKDGTNRKRLITFTDGTTIAGLPQGGLARDARYVYFVLDQHPDSGFLRTLYRVDPLAAQVEAICDLPGEEEKIVGGWNNQLVLTYAPSSYKETPVEELEMHVVRIDPDKGDTVPVLTHSYLDTGACWDNKYILLRSDNQICTYDLEDGKLLQEKAVDLPHLENGYWQFNGMVDGKMTVSQRGAEGDWYVYGIDPVTGKTQPIQHQYAYRDEYWGSTEADNDSLCPCTVLAETEDQYLICTGVIQKKPQSAHQGILGFFQPETISEKQYSLISKEAFWNGSGSGTPITVIQDIALEDRKDQMDIPSFLIH